MPNRVQDISKHINPTKTRGRKFSRIQYFLFMHIEESKKLQGNSFPKMEKKKKNNSPQKTKMNEMNDFHLSYTLLR